GSSSSSSPVSSASASPRRSRPRSTPSASSSCSGSSWSSPSPRSAASLAADGRVLPWEALLNVRDLGGLPSAHGPIARGAIVRSDALHRLNDAGRAALTAHGVRTVIDMRNAAEVDEKPYQLGGDVLVSHLTQQTKE